MEEIRQQVEQHGFALVSHCIPEGAVRALQESIDSEQHGTRNLLANAIVRSVACSEQVRRPVAAVLGTGCFAVRGIFFNKNPKANWKVAWHQDCVIAVRERLEIEGWGPWSTKAGVTHVRPAPQIMQQMLAIRIHLDECGKDDGPIRVIPGSHLRGMLSDRQIQNWAKEEVVICTAHRGDAILMRPLLLHASSPAVQPSNRRVIHLEFAAQELPAGATWHDRVCQELHISEASGLRG
jgi:ectoine hydroxylase-related dioxygenase (phytanoyl-CoA dioxygenase family)